MGKERLDASLGLAFSLKVFEQYRKSGLLEAEMHAFPGIRGRCKGCLHLVEGKVVTCYLEDRMGLRQPVSKEALIQHDSRKGPFEWMLTTLPPPPPVSPQYTTPRPVQQTPVPKRIAPLDLEKLEGWTHRQKTMLSLVYDVVDGKRTIADIQADTPLSPEVVEEALRVLLAMKVIIIPS